MNYAEIKKNDIANGWGVRTVLFVSGCRNGCKNCFNRDTWDFNYGKPYTEEVENGIIESLAPDYVNGLSILGGEPFEPENQRELLELCKKVRKIHPNKDIWCYTGFTVEELFDDNCRAKGEYTKTFLDNIDVLVDGRYIESLKNISLQFRGSENQRVIDLNKSREQQKIVIWEKLRR